VLTPATIADHVTQHHGDPIAFSFGELQSLCKHCHDSDKRFLELRGYERPTIGEDGWPIEDQEGADPPDRRDASPEVISKRAGGRG